MSARWWFARQKTKDIARLLKQAMQARHYDYIEYVFGCIIDCDMLSRAQKWKLTYDTLMRTPGYGVLPQNRAFVGEVMLPAIKAAVHDSVPRAVRTQVCKYKAAVHDSVPMAVRTRVCKYSGNRWYDGAYSNMEYLLLTTVRDGKLYFNRRIIVTITGCWFTPDCRSCRRGLMEYSCKRVIAMLEASGVTKL